jgi:hypothetical protein
MRHDWRIVPRSLIKEMGKWVTSADDGKKLLHFHIKPRVQQAKATYNFQSAYRMSTRRKGLMHSALITLSDYRQTSGLWNFIFWLWILRLFSITDTSFHLSNPCRWFSFSISSLETATCLAWSNCLCVGLKEEISNWTVFEKYLLLFRGWNSIIVSYSCEQHNLWTQMVNH